MDRQVAPAELEEILLKHPSVKEVVVVGVPHHEYGEAARAFVILHDYVLGDEGTERELCALVEGKSPVLFVSFFLWRFYTCPDPVPCGHRLCFPPSLGSNLGALITGLTLG